MKLCYMNATAAQCTSVVGNAGHSCSTLAACWEHLRLSGSLVQVFIIEPYEFITAMLHSNERVVQTY